MTRIYLGLAGALAIVLALWGIHHAGYASGVDATEARYAAAAAKSLAANTKKQDTAETAHATESTDIAAFNISHTITASRLCQRTPAAKVPAADKVDAGAGAGAADVQPVRETDNGQPDDRTRLLGLLEQRADEVSAQLREWQRARAP